MDLLDHPRYKDKPVLLFFEKFVLDVIGELEPKQKKILEDLDLKAVFGTQASEWREVIEEVLKLSKTIKIAVLDEWFKYIDSKESTGRSAEADVFTRLFADAYFADNSAIDVWPDQASLEAAQKRIDEHQRTQEKESLF